MKLYKLLKRGKGRWSEHQLFNICMYLLNSWVVTINIIILNLINIIIIFNLINIIIILNLINIIIILNLINIIIILLLYIINF